MFFLGIDIGSQSCDVVLIDADKSVIADAIVPTGARNKEAIDRATSEVLRVSGISKDQVKATVSTGYGRDRVENRLQSVTEITCHACGIHHLIPETRILIDIGGQDSKGILLNSQGQVIDFAMNDKCAAGTGRFLEAMSRALQVDIDELGELDRGAQHKLEISSMCTVFAESEVVSLIANGKPVNEIVSGIHRAIATRTLPLIKRLTHNINNFKIAMSGGVARNKGVVSAINYILDGVKVAVPESPDTVGALGAALIAREKASSRHSHL
jgi:predicted CoA-substrate-specific enzyme activase